MNEKNKKNISSGYPVLPYTEPMTYSQMMKYIDILAKRYTSFHVTYLGESILGKKIPIITLGTGKKTALYIGAHHGMEWITTALLLKFANEYCQMFDVNGYIGHTSISYLNASRSICIIPMLNPDGVDYQICGVETQNPLYDRLIKMNSGSNDFSSWQANARGVDLNHNYDASFEEYAMCDENKSRSGGSPTKWCGEYPESEPESGLLANFVRFNEDIRLCLSFHSQGEEIYYGDKFGPSAESLRAGQVLSRISGYKLCKTEGSAVSGGFTDWVVAKLGKPAFTIECGKGKNPLPIDSLFEIYCKLRRMLFEAPMII
ncbi:MAG: M14 family zinc carboxypeptidase [Clostridia bacterium]|nr:M14 family zinc carboxypeptidase [Clostridia bacterium]